MEQESQFNTEESFEAEPIPAGTVPLYRIENPNITARPNGETSHKELVGQWFSPDLDKVTHYLRKSTQTFGRDAHIVDGAQLVIAYVPEEMLDTLHVSQDSTASHMDVESDNYIVPRDGTINITTVPLDESLSDLRGDLGNIDRLSEARKRIAELADKIQTTTEQK